MQYFNAVTGKWEDMTTGGFSSGTGSSSNPIDLSGPTIKSTRSSAGGFNLSGLLGGILENGDDWIRAFNGQSSAPDTVTNNYTPAQQSIGNNNVLLFGGIGAVVLLLLVVLFKK